MESFQVEYDHVDAVHLLSIKLTRFLSQKAFLSSKLVCLCIGTDRSTGDSLGPLVGTFLSEADESAIIIYGTLSNPVHAMNLDQIINNIKHAHPSSYILVVDACLGKYKDIGLIKVGNGPLSPGKGLKKNLPEVGDFYIKGIVDMMGTNGMYILQSTRLHLVYSMAKVISSGILKAVDQLKSSKE
ncbi:spore protease YyaC [Thermoflavimicrobium dichotomicum]|uniref:Putative sporulation protein YyaC n=1 Tax=Thermoflavimicrobium dichotomicum TaxID=46223 RepID=A0A1I3SD67_9BACL|nr:spore protease YyaC [Thermoflavimicrobium dichotomicum]SFJ55549.1 putative sporulation protein YyaC [Thermoflavimicrobium dichotomicum]